MYQNAYLPAVGENGGVHRVSGYHMGYAVDGVTPSTGSGQHGGRLPIDVGGKDTGKSKVYAGNDMTALACGSSAQGVWFFTSTEPLLLVSGEICYPILECIHMTAADRSALGLAAGKTIPTGTWMYSEGTAGGASTHLHIDLGRAQDKPAAGRCPWHSIGCGSYAPDDNYPISRALFLPAGMTVHSGVELGNGNVKDNAGYIWHRDTGEQTIGEVRIGASNYMRRTGPGTNYAVVDWGEFSADDCKALAGRLYAVYEVSDGWLRITQRGVGGENGQWICADAGAVKHYDDSNCDNGDETAEIKIPGIDVSHHQHAMDWDAVKSSGKVQFAMLRAGYGRYDDQVDKQFERNYAECKRLGIPVGAYWYSYATTVDEARAEMELFLSTIRGKQIEYPVCFDQEYEQSILALTNAQRTAIVKEALEMLEEAGYYAALYCSRDWINTKLDAAELEAYDLWVADYTDAETSPTALPYGMRQVSSDNSFGVPGVPVDAVAGLDCDYAYKDYPAIIKVAGLNGWNKETSKKYQEISLDEIEVPVSVAMEFYAVAKKYGLDNDVAYHAENVTQRISIDPTVLTTEAAMDFYNVAHKYALDNDVAYHATYIDTK